jgi:hypothetical protein
VIRRLFDRRKMSEAIPFASSDAWLLHAVLLAAKEGEAALDEVVGTADMIQHAMLTFDEIDGGVARLSRAGLLAIKDKRFQLSPAAAALGRRLAKLSLREAGDALRRELGISEPVPPFEPTPPDPAWVSGAFTVDDLRRAEKEYRRRFWRQLKQGSVGK